MDKRRTDERRESVRVEAEFLLDAYLFPEGTRLVKVEPFVKDEKSGVVYVEMTVELPRGD